MSLEAKTRAEDLATRGKIRRWIEQFKKLSAQMPKELTVFVAAGTPVVLANDRNGEPFNRGGGYDPDAQVPDANITGGRWDGGDW